MRLVLEIISGPNTGQKIIAQAGESVTIGRTPKAQVELEDTFMSGQHFAIECMGGACGVRDLKSRNGTRVNGAPVKIAVLNDGDKISAGQTDFMVHIDADDSSGDQAPTQLNVTLPPSQPLIKKPEDTPVRPPKPAPVTSVYPDPRYHVQTKFEPPPTREVPGNFPARKEAAVEPAMDAYQAATPEGVLMGLLQKQTESLMALVDAVKDRRVLDILHSSDAEYRSLYNNQQNEAISPLLVRVPAHSLLLKQMIHEGWGHGWGIYLTCRVSPAELRDHFRRSFMVSMPDGAELFSRFYDPRFFRGFLEGCTAAEAERFFGPISAYLMEAERPEILLEFKRSSTGVEKKGHLLTRLD
jgi:pSer/pThr/pTyr-binding forkhead associated (FHA) protein